MKRLLFLVNRGENDCFMIHGIDWAAYHEGASWSELTAAIRADVGRIFSGDSRPDRLDFKFPDGNVTSIPA